MQIPSHLLPLSNTRPKAVEKAAVSLEKSESNPDTTKQEQVLVTKVTEKRKGEDRRKRNIKPLLDTRSGKDRRLENNQSSIDVKV